MDVIIVVDMLNDFVRPDGALPCGDAAAIVPFVMEKIADARRRGGRVIYLCDAHLPDDPEFSIWPLHCVDGTFGAKIIDALAPIPGDVVLKKRKYSGFFGTGLHDIIKELKPQKAEVVGVCTSICVMDTVGGLSDREIPVTVYKDGVADFDAEMHVCALKRMEKIYRAKVA
jgi:nicotinamidase/pyrazinamidase